MENQQQHPIFGIQLTLDQVNVILSTMGKLPYESIAPLMNSIQNQANAQMQQFQAAMAAQQEQADAQAAEDSTNIIQ